MSKEFEAFNRITLHTEYDNNDSYDCLKFEDDCDLVEQALIKAQELKSENSAVLEENNDLYAELTFSSKQYKELTEYTKQQKKVLEIIIKKCIYSGNLINVKIAEDYNDYLSLFEDRVEKQYLLTQEEFELLKRWVEDEKEN